jgi:hypothetical protein
VEIGIFIGIESIGDGDLGRIIIGRILLELNG